MAPFCLGKLTNPGRTGNDTRLFPRPVLRIARTGTSWRNPRPTFGKWKTVMIEAWFVTAIGIVPSVGSLAWVAWRWWLKQVEQRHNADLSREQRLQGQLDTRRAALSNEHAELFDRLRTELERAETGRLEAEREAKKWVWLARWWYRAGHDQFLIYRRIAHDVRNLQQWMVWLKKRHPNVDLLETAEVPPREEPPLGVEDPMKPKQVKP